ncbi:hypothetical protein TNCV_4953021 [Trichonephila clavipes]|nr:hypothetical protein TNCV_4953021 [Trichonephila clavipes]
MATGSYMTPIYSRSQTFSGIVASLFACAQGIIMLRLYHPLEKVSSMDAWQSREANLFQHTDGLNGECNDPRDIEQGNLLGVTRD